MNVEWVSCVCGHEPWYHRKLGTSGEARLYCFIQTCKCARLKRRPVDE